MDEGADLQLDGRLSNAMRPLHGHMLVFYCASAVCLCECVCICVLVCVCA